MDIRDCAWLLLLWTALFGAVLSYDGKEDFVLFCCCVFSLSTQGNVSVELHLEQT